MNRLSVELVPRNRVKFSADLDLLSSRFPSVDTVNIPDIERYDLGSIDASSLAGESFKNRIPHIRACSVRREEKLPFAKKIENSGIKEVLVIQGDNYDPVEGMEFCSTLELIRKFTEELPDVRVYAGLDQYRCSMGLELEYARKKIESGASGFFTQPFFDIGYLTEYMEELCFADVFWGVSPVTSERSKKYWQNVNKVKFPENFSCDLEWNLDFARKVLAEAVKRHCNVYLMPIKTDIVEYLSGLI